MPNPLHQVLGGLVGDLQEFRRKPAMLADYLPWAALLGPGLIVNKDGSIQQTIAFRGPDTDSATDNGLMAHRHRFGQLLARLGDQWCVHVEAARRPAPGYLEGGAFADPASLMVDQERRAFFEGEGHGYEALCYLTLTFLPSGDTQGLLQYFMEDDDARQQSDAVAKRELEYFHETVREVLGSMRDLMASAWLLNDADVLTYLHGTISERHHRVEPLAVPMYLDACLTDSDLVTGMRPKLGAHYLAMVSLRGFPATSYPRLMAPLSNLPFAYRWVGRWMGLSREAAQKLMTTARRNWFKRRKSIRNLAAEQASGQESQLQQPEAHMLSADAEDALAELAIGTSAFGYFTATITVMDEDEELARHKANEICRLLNERGFVAKIETLNAVEAWLGSLPGHSHADVRRPVVSTLTLADLVSISMPWSGPHRNEHLKAPALMQTVAGGNTPFRLSTQPPGSDVGHQLILGPTGAGKSTLLAFMALQFLRYQDAQVFIFDKGASCRAPVLAVGGDFFDLGDPDDEIAFQPLRHLDDTDQIAWAVNWLGSLLRLRGLEVSQERDQHLHNQLQLLAQNPPEDRTLSVFSGLIQDLDARRALTSFTLDGPYGHLLDAEERGFGYGRVQAFEMERFMRDVSARDVLVPVLTYLFHRLEDRFDGRPTLLIVDEAWSFLLDDDFAPQIVKWLTRLRKKNVSVILATQNLADIIQCPISQTLIQQTMSRIFLPNFRALDPVVQPLYEAFGLNDRQIEIIAHATPKREYYYESSVGNRLFELALGPTALAFAGASTPADQTLINEILEAGQRSVFAETFLDRKGLTEEAAALSAYRTEMEQLAGEAA